MRILILSQARSGSTGLQAWLKEEFKEEVMVNPFNPYDKSEEELDDDYEWLVSDRGLILKFVDNLFLKVSRIPDAGWLIRRFDKVIGLTRENDIDYAKSRLIGDITNDWRSSSSSHPHITDDALDKYKLEQYVEEAKINKQFIRDLPLFQITYEQIYKDKNVNGLLEYLELKPDYLDYLFENKNVTKNWNF
jgi:hypothetical protein